MYAVLGVSGYSKHAHAQPAGCRHESYLLVFLLQMGYLPANAPGLTIETNVPFNLTSFALSLLLVFRTNSSYSRWAEARSIWGGVTNRSRDILRQVCCQARKILGSQAVVMTREPFLQVLHSAQRDALCIC